MIGQFQRVHKTRVAVLGAGIQGTCLALALAKRNIDVDLFDQHHEPLRGASIHNEGKIHLGFVYANDPDHRTHALMIRGALAFSDLMETFSGIPPSDYVSDSTFYYAVPHDSLLSPDAVEHHFAAVAAEIRKQSDGNGNYLGRDLNELYRRCSSDETHRWYSPSHIAAAFHTEEGAVSTRTLAGLLREAIRQAPGIHFHGGSEILSAHNEPGGPVQIEVRTALGIDTHDYPAVVNGLWDGRLLIDRTVGLTPPRNWLFRYKASVRFHVPELAGAGIPSTTMVLGEYGDVVDYGGGHFYLSWYPACRLAATSQLDGRILHQLRNKLHDPAMARETLDAMAARVPSLEKLRPYVDSAEVSGGVIFAWGDSDINDPASTLHQRSMIGPQAHGAYITLDTGKYTTAPLFAQETAELVLSILA